VSCFIESDRQMFFKIFPSTIACTNRQLPKLSALTSATVIQLLNNLDSLN
jgi:hypothetical protein